MPKTELEQVIRILALIINREREEITISPSWVADRGYAELDPHKRAPTLVKKVALFELRQLARGLLRMHFEPTLDGEEPHETHPLFPQLQWRYPKMRLKGEMPRYILLEKMTKSDLDFNVARLKSVGTGMLEHATALEDYGRTHVLEGVE